MRNNENDLPQGCKWPFFETVCQKWNCLVICWRHFEWLRTYSLFRHVLPKSEWNLRYFKSFLIFLNLAFNWPFFKASWSRIWTQKLLMWSVYIPKNPTSAVYDVTQMIKGMYWQWCELNYRECVKDLDLIIRWLFWVIFDHFLSNCHFFRQLGQ